MAVLSYYLIIRPAKQASLPPPLVQKMFLNNVVSVALSYVSSHPLGHIMELTGCTCCCHAIVAGIPYIRHYQTSNRFVPIIGDILIGVWKVNLRNAALFEEFLRVRGEEYLKGGGQAISERATMAVRRHRINIRYRVLTG